MLKENIDQIGKLLISELIKNLIQMDKVASGKLINSLDYQVIETIEGVFLELVSEDYLYNVDKGRQPGKMPPLMEIKEWNKIRGLERGKLTEDQLAFVVARGIGRNGIPATNVIQKSIDNIYSSIDKLIDEGLEIEIDKILDNLK